MDDGFAAPVQLSMESDVGAFRISRQFARGGHDALHRRLQSEGIAGECTGEWPAAYEADKQPAAAVPLLPHIEHSGRRPPCVTPCPLCYATAPSSVGDLGPQRLQRRKPCNKNIFAFKQNPSRQFARAMPRALSHGARCSYPRWLYGAIKEAGRAGDE